MTAAKANFSQIRLVSSQQVPFKVTTLPELVAWDASGNPLLVDLGLSAVEARLTHIQRKQYP